MAGHRYTRRNFTYEFQCWCCRKVWAQPYYYLSHRCPYCGKE